MFFKNLKQYFLFGFFVNICCILFVGAFSVKLVTTMANNVSSVSRKSESAGIIDNFQLKSLQALLAAQRYFLYHDADDFEVAVDILADTEIDLSLYLEHEKKAADEGSKKEIMLLADIHKSLNRANKRLSLLSLPQEELEGRGAKALMDFNNDIASIREKVDGVNVLHSREIATLVRDTDRGMHRVVVVYVLFCAIGVLASFLGYVLLVRRLLDPINELDVVTERVALGDYSIRLYVKLNNEIGSLYGSFNRMTEKLQEADEERKNFYKQMGNIVSQRTESLREKERSLVQAQNEIVRMEKIATLGQIATSVNHEIRTPLNVLGMNVQILSKKLAKLEVDAVGEEKVAELESIAGMIGSEVVRINKILQEFVLFAKISYPALHLRDMNKIIREFAEGFAERARDAEVTLSLDLSPELPPLLLDGNKIIQALLNLSVNAMNAMPYGGELKICSRLDDDFVTLVIVDTGEGILEHEMAHIFEPFFTTREAGMGLGLPIVQRIVGEHKGTIACASNPGKGTTFTIHLPVNI